jgi:betaine-aldehyde dehydrogenase
VEPAGSETLEVRSPSTLELVGSVPVSTTADIDRAVAAARKAFDEGPWPQTSPKERADVMAAISLNIQTRMEEFANLITSENGSPVSWSLMGQVLAATMVLDYYTGLVTEFPFEEWRDGLLGPSLVRKEPVGVAGGIVPWNVPLFVSMLKIAPTLAAGGTIVLKPAPETPLDANLLAECFEGTGLPPGVVNIVAADREVGQHLVTHPGVDKIGFTGSTAAGKKIASLCGEQLKRVTLELGGKSAAIVLDDADVESTVAGLMPASMMNNGQACVAQTRILASRSKYDEVVGALTAAVGALKVGDPMDPTTEVGPLVAERQRDRVEGYLASGKEQGARVTTGGGRPADLDTGWYVDPTVFADVDNSMKIAQEEIFGPVLAVIPFDDEAHAVRIANDSTYGLSGSVWSADADRALEVAKQVRTGTMSVNGFMLEFGSPFGGYKQSGVGREMGPEGLNAYLESKSIAMPADAGGSLPMGS